jgi:threonine/homoserine/homoserine lactone efflux protein
MNITATQLSIQEGMKKAWTFGLGVAIVEIIYLRFALTGMHWVLQHKILFTVLGWLTVILFLALGIASFITAHGQDSGKKALLLNNKLNRFVLGLTMSAVNPAQIPFWFIWSTYLVDNKVLQPNAASYNLFTIGAGSGTLTGVGGLYLWWKLAYNKNEYQ